MNHHSFPFKNYLKILQDIDPAFLNGHIIVIKSESVCKQTCNPVIAGPAFLLIPACFCQILPIFRIWRVCFSNLEWW